MTDAQFYAWCASAISLLSVWFYGQQPRWLGPTVGLTAQVPWTLLAFSSDLMGLLVANGFFACAHLRNLHKAYRSAKHLQAQEGR